MRIASALGLALVVVAPLSAQDFAKERLEKSPRHHEWVEVKHGDRTVQCFLAFPEVKEKTPVVIVIHENRGLTDWVRSVADQLAEAGYIAIAPDLLSGMAPGGKNTPGFSSGDHATRAIRALPPQQITADLNAVADHAKTIPAGNGKIAVVGFCWGGGQSLRFATNRNDLAAAFVFYGSDASVDAGAVARINCPVYGFYGGNDARVNATIPGTTRLMRDGGKTYEPVTYEEAGHGFMRAGEDPHGSAANKKAREEAWKRWADILKKL